MKKILISLLLLVSSMYTIDFVQASSSMDIIVQIQGANNLYLIQLDTNKVHVKSIANRLYTPLSCMKEPNTLANIDFTNDYDCLVDSLNNIFSESIDYYVSLDMKTLLQDLQIKETTYDYKTLSSLTKVGKEILNNISIKTIVQYQKYIKTNLGLKEMYDLYDFFSDKDFKVKYYYLHYFIHQNKYLLFDTHFYLKN